MNAVLDVHYKASTATVACLGFHGWTASEPAFLHLSSLDITSEYRPGEFYLRELPCLLHALSLESGPFHTLIIDGYVHLKPPRLKGLGAHLAEALPRRVPVIGVAKNPLRLADRFVQVFRGRSGKPLFVSAVNTDLEAAAEHIRTMHGEHRIPTLLKMTDRGCRTGSVTS